MPRLPQQMQLLLPRTGNVRWPTTCQRIKKAAIPVLRHRVSANFQAQAEGKSSDDIVLELLKVVSEPEPAKYLPKTKK